MNTKTHHSIHQTGNHRRRVSATQASPILLGLLLGWLVCETPVAAQRVRVSTPPPPSAAIRSELGTIGVVTPGTRTEYSFVKSGGKASSAAEGAATARDAMFEWANEQMGIPEVGPLAAATTVALTPMAALIGAVTESGKRVPSHELEKSEKELAEAMAELAVAARLRNEFLKAAGGRLFYPFRLRAVETGALADTGEYGSLADQGLETVLEIGVESVRLQRISASDTSFALFINASARLVRVRDGAVLYDQPFQFRSGTSLFIDWTHNRGEPMRNVAETGCRYLAEKMFTQLFLQPSVDGSAAKMAGTKGGLRTVPGAPAEFVAGQTARPDAAKVSKAAPEAKPRSAPSRPTAVAYQKSSFANAPSVSTPGAARRSASGIVEISSPPLAPRHLVNLGRIGIIATSTIPNLAVQRPLNKDRAVSEARDAVQARVEEFEPIPYINLLAYAAAVPASLGGQIVGAIKGVRASKLEPADAAATEAATGVNLKETLRQEVLRQAQAATPYPIALVKKPFPRGAENDFMKMAGVMSGTLAWVPKGQTPAQYLMSQGIDTVLEIQLLHPALNGNGDINPPMAFHVELRGRLMRVREGEEICAFALKYRSVERKFTDWAANNGELLRKELENFSQTVAATIVDQLSLRVLPREMPVPLAHVSSNGNAKAVMPVSFRH